MHIYLLIFYSKRFGHNGMVMASKLYVLPYKRAPSTDLVYVKTRKYTNQYLVNTILLREGNKLKWEKVYV